MRWDVPDSTFNVFFPNRCNFPWTNCVHMEYSRRITHWYLGCDAMLHYHVLKINSLSIFYWNRCEVNVNLHCYQFTERLYYNYTIVMETLLSNQFHFREKKYRWIIDKRTHHRQYDIVNVHRHQCRVFATKAGKVPKIPHSSMKLIIKFNKDLLKMISC